MTFCKVGMHFQLLSVSFYASDRVFDFAKQNMWIWFNCRRSWFQYEGDAVGPKAQSNT